jgi:hypothetical protein
MGARQIITVIITFRKSNKNPPEHQTGALLGKQEKKHPIYKE